jgi:hypothetical protein
VKIGLRASRRRAKRMSEPIDMLGLDWAGGAFVSGSRWRRCRAGAEPLLPAAQNTH